MQPSRLEGPAATASRAESCYIHHFPTAVQCPSHPPPCRLGLRAPLALPGPSHHAAISSRRAPFTSLLPARRLQYGMLQCPDAMRGSREEGGSSTPFGPLAPLAKPLGLLASLARAAKRGVAYVRRARRNGWRSCTADGDSNSRGDPRHVRCRTQRAGCGASCTAEADPPKCTHVGSGRR